MSEEEINLGLLTVKERIGAISIIDIDPETWSKKHDIKIKSKKCQECNKLLLINEPAISQDYVGFIKKGCECGSTIVKCIFIPYSKEEKDIWSSYNLGVEE